MDKSIMSVIDSLNITTRLKSIIDSSAYNTEEKEYAQNRLNTLQSLYDEPSNLHQIGEDSHVYFNGKDLLIGKNRQSVLLTADEIDKILAILLYNA